MSGVPNRADRTHPDPRELERFMRGELSPVECSAVVSHMLAGCPRCAAVTRQFWSFGERPRALRVLIEEGLAVESGGPCRLLRHPTARVL